MTEPTYEELTFVAGDIANDLLLDAFESVRALLEYVDKPSAAEAILIAAHALLAQRDLHHEERRRNAPPAGDDCHEPERQSQTASTVGGERPC